MTDASARIDQILPSQRDSTPHTFVYAGEWQNGSFEHQRMFFIDRDRVTWTYELPGLGEYGQVTMLPNGNVLFARYGGATEVNPAGDTVWNFDAPSGTEVHTCRPVGTDHVFMVINGAPARVVLQRKTDNAVEHELVVPTGGTDAHSMFRSCEYTSNGTYLLGHMDLGRVAEYSQSGDVVWQVDVPSPWGVSRLENGNTLVSGDHSGFIREYRHDGSICWEFNRGDADRLGVRLYCVQQAVRLPSGNTVFANWCSAREAAADRSRSVQLLEVTPDKQIAWRLSQWRSPNLGPASYFHFLRS